MSSPAVTSQEVKSVAALALGFGLVGIDRFLISTMYPTIAADLNLGYGDIGTITGALAIAWGFAALIVGNLSDRIGQRRVLVWSLIAFSLLIGASGLATSLIGLVLVRVVMGFADGAFTPASISATIQASPPQRHGRNIGLQQCTLVLFGLGLSPLLVSKLLQDGVDWRYIFLLFVIPGLLLAAWMWRIIPDRRESANVKRDSLKDWRSVLKYKNVWLLMGGMLCWLTCLITTSAFLPSYFLDHLKIGPEKLGVLMSALGLGAMLGAIIPPALSDRIGRKPIMIISSIGALITLAVLERIGPDIATLFAALAAVSFFTNALITMTVGPIAAETVPPSLMATASGVVIATGEFFGGGLAPMVVGQVAERFGIEHVLRLPMIMMAVGVGLSIALTETRTKQAENHL